jgi:hypothetical protein
MPLQYANASAVCLQKGMRLVSLETELDFREITKLIAGKRELFTVFSVAQKRVRFHIK